MSLISARQHFIQTVSRPEAQINLTEAALWIAAEEYPQLDLEQCLQKLARIADRIRDRLPAERYPLKVIQTINTCLYGELGFHGNEADYYDPRNSFLNEVLERHTGIPITLALVYLDVARRVDFPMFGIDMPAHFMIRPEASEIEFLVDPFHRGEILFAEDCQALLSKIYGQTIAMQPAFFERTTPHRLLARMLTNLKMIYLRRGDHHKSLAAIERLLILTPNAPLQLRDRGILYYHLGNWLDARQDLQAYLDLTPNAPDQLLVQQILEQMQP